MTSKAAPYQQDTKEGADLPREAPPGQVNDPSYKTRGTESVPVVDDDAPVEDPMKTEQADSDRQLGMSFSLSASLSCGWISGVGLDCTSMFSLSLSLCVCVGGWWYQVRGVREKK